MKLLLYCTKAKPYLFPMKENKPFELNSKCSKYGSLNGKIVAECDFEVEEIKNVYDGLYETSISREQLYKRSCLSELLLDDYLQGKDGYAIHIKNLQIFDEPRYLDEVKSPKMYEAFKKDLKKAYEEDQKILDDIYLDKAPDGAVPNSVELLKYIEYEFYGLKKAPQNMMYVYDGDEKKVLISIRPQWMCKICNREKDIEVRKIVLKEMLPDE